MSTMHVVVAAIGAVALAAAAAALAAALVRRRAADRHTAALLQARKTAYNDLLTSLGNRAAFHRLMATPHGQGGTVILLNIDGYRTHLRTIGERAFNDAIVRIARRIQHEAAAAGADAFRLRRDEFAVVVPARALRGTTYRRGSTAGTGDLSGDVAGARAGVLAGVLAGRLVAAVHAATASHRAAVPMRARAGIATAPAYEEPDGRLVLAHADVALRSAKQSNAAWVRHPAEPS
ncbi:GGDEF domain-containing protein [Dactylosporangium aurantiacum]|uniref:GGDEF domain-containing protein n=1 Tax=Dactylosporangium aurantiacum TaxID=35754 RepID=A0A9Q9ISV4_9ACTN|nr:GGDEF domain-containing protein [Dactylosporangium aurantiacum]MDG6104021.1 GGDEF domain-containing protein [Dactylosporangium aurantiacum]UWZ58804.1 GGDEF domain-containing protein [Dactylosporangium aurantiacum]